jgi:3-oxoacyl-[acyl-carrier protein] reductase
MSEQKVALITGGARGIARAITLDLASRGWSVAICYRTSARQATEVIDTVEREGAKGLAFQVDVSSPEAATGLVRQVHQEW